MFRSPQTAPIPDTSQTAAVAPSGADPFGLPGAVIPPAEAAAAELDLDLPAEDGGLVDIDAMEREWQEAGSLSETSYARLARAGIPREVVDAYVAGQVAMGQARRAELLEPLGGEEGFAELAAWASRNLDPADIEAYEAALQGTPEQARLALRGLYAAFQESVGRRPKLVGGRGGVGDDGLFLSARQLADAIRDPRYKRDPAYREQVQARLARSNVFGRR